MKSLRFDKLELISLTERTARAIPFHPKLTVIKGENDVGKSSIIKNIYWVFGAGVAMHPQWKDAKVKAYLQFTVDGVRFSIFRDGNTIALFDANDEIIICANSITKEFSPVISSVIDFKLILSNRDGEAGIPPPAFAFLPFYMDQDRGWQQTLESFDNLQQYPSPRKNIIEYHSGIRPNKYYELQAQRRQIDMERLALVQDRSAVENAIKKLGLEPSFSGVELSSGEHEASINRLLAYLEELRDFRQRRVVEFTRIVDERSLILEQLNVAQAAMNEFTKDFQWVQGIEVEQVLCPTCGTVHQNNFANRFAILDDRDACQEFMTQSVDRLRTLADDARRTQSSLNEVDNTLREIESALEEKRGDLTLKQVIEEEGRRAAQIVFTAQIAELSSEIGLRLAAISKIEEDLKKLDDKKRRQEIESFYAELMFKNLKQLNVNNINFSSASKIEKKVNDTGSDQPRAVLSYHLAFLKTIYKFSDAIRAPMVIDSPNQQDQDSKNVGEMIKLIFDNVSEEGQIILGTVSLHDQEYDDGSTIVLTEKHQALSVDQYSSIAARLQPIFDKVRNSGGRKGGGVLSPDDGQGFLDFS